MPIANNLNLMLLDKAGNAALIEFQDGRYAAKRIGAQSPEQLLWATNHAVLPGLIPHEPKAFIHSVRRYEWIGEQLGNSSGITKEQLRDMLLSKYPDGLCCHYFEEFFGTTKSMVISPVDGTIDLCWGGRRENGWDLFDIARPLENGMQKIEISFEKADPKIYQYQPK